MSNVSKPILGLLLGAVVLFAMVMVVFKPSSHGSSSPNTPVYQSAINKAHQAVATNAANARLGATASTKPAAKPAAKPAHTPVAHSSKAVPARKRVTASKPTSAAAGRSQASQLQSALSQHKVVGLLFYNPSAADDQAVKTELAAAATAHGVVKLAVPVSEISSFTALTDTVPVTVSPTLILIDRQGNASTITGFADRFEIAQRLNALAAGK